MIFNLLSNNSFNAYSTNGLRFSTGVSLVAGGYIKLGNLCIVTMRILTTGTIQPATVIVSGLPAYNNISVTKIVNCTNSKNINLEISSNGELASDTTITGTAILLSAIYLCNY